MPTETISAAIQPLNEFARAVVALPKDATLYSDTHFMAIAWDQPDDASAPRPTILGAGRGVLPYLPAYRLINLLCGDRAMRTVDGTLRVCRRTVTPEAYLGLWRAALQAALSPEELADQLGLKILVTLGAALASARQASSCWTTSPFKSFSEFEEAYSSRFTLGPTARGASGFRITLDLREATAARDAFYGRDLVTNRDDAEGCVEVALVPMDAGERIWPSTEAQPSLFGEVTP